MQSTLVFTVCEPNLVRLRSVPYSKIIVAPGQEPGKDLPYLYHSSGTKAGWGGPASSHSAYESMYADASAIHRRTVRSEQDKR